MPFLHKPLRAVGGDTECAELFAELRFPQETIGELWERVEVGRGDCGGGARVGGGLREWPRALGAEARWRGWGGDAVETLAYVSVGFGDGDASVADWTGYAAVICRRVSFMVREAGGGVGCTYLVLRRPREGRR